MNIGQLIATLGVDTTGLDRARQDMQKFNQDLKRMGDTMKHTGRQMSMYITAPLALVGGVAFKMQKDFESSMTKVIGLVGVSREQVQAWSSDIKEMTTKVGKSPKELADALFFITSAGLKGAEALQVLESAAKGSAVGLGETRVVADLVTSAMNAYGKANLSASQSMDILVAAVREGKAEANALAASMGQVLPIASAMGVTFDQVGAAIAAMTRTGTSAETAAMQLKNILASMLKPSQEAEESLRMMGTSARELRDVIKNRGVLDALMKIRELTNIYGEEIMAKVFPSIRALSGVLDLMGSNMEDNRKIFESLKDASGSLNKAFEETSETVEFKYNQAIATAKTALVELGESFREGLIPMLEAVTNKIKMVISWYTNLTEAKKQLILRTVAITAAIGPLLVVIGSVISLLSGPVGWVALVVALGIGLGVLISKISNTRKELISYDEILKNIGGTTQNFIKHLGEEKARIISLFSALEKTNQGTEVRKNLINLINSEYGKYLPNLLTEKTRLNEIQTIRENLIRTLTAELALKSQQEKITAIVNQQLEREQTILSGYATEKAPLASWIAAFEEYAKGVEYVLDLNAGKFFRKEQEEIKSLMEVTGYSYDLLIGIFKDLGKYRKADEKAIESYMNVYQKYIDLILKSPPPPPPPSPPGIKRPEVPSKITPITATPMVSFEGQDEYYKGLKTQLGAVKGIAKIMADYIDQLQFTNELEEALGKTFDENAAKIQLTQQTIEQLIAEGMDPMHSTILSLKDQLKDLGASTETTFVDVMTSINNTAQIIGGALSELFTSYDQLLSVQKSNQLQAIKDYAAQTHQTEQWLNNEMEKIEKEYADRHKRLATYLAIINTSLAVTNALATVEPFWVALIMAGLAAAKGGLEIATIQAQEFAEGGIVPPGYPNDSYPARLTSGEMVTPPGALPDFGGGISEEKLAELTQRQTDSIVNAIKNAPVLIVGRGLDVEGVQEGLNKIFYKNKYMKHVSGS